MVGNVMTPTHLVIVLVVALLVLGPKRLPSAGRGLGEAMRGFKDALASGDRSDTTTGQIYEDRQILQASDVVGAATASHATSPTPAAPFPNDAAPSATAIDPANWQGTSPGSTSNAPPGSTSNPPAATGELEDPSRSASGPQTTSTAEGTSGR